MGRLNEKEVLEKIVDIICEKKGENLIVYDVRGLTSFTDYILIVTLNSEVQMKAILKEMKRNISLSESVEGEASSGWILVDYDGVIVNLFLPQVREFYSLERLWGDAKKVKIKETTNFQDTLL